MPFTNQHPAPSSSFSPRKYQIITPSRNLKEVLLVVVVVVDIHTKGGGLIASCVGTLWFLDTKRLTLNALCQP